MSIKLSAALALAVAAVGLSGCATALNTNVTRYQAMPAPQGQTFVVVPGDGMARNGGLEFQRYAAIVAQQLAARGYTPATNTQSANMIVQFGYGVDRGRSAISPTRSADMAYGPYGFGGFGFGRYLGLFPRFGYGGSPFYYGWDDPFWYGGGIDSYVEYHSQTRPPHPPGGDRTRRCSTAAPRRAPRPAGSTRGAEPDRGDVHGLPGPERRDGEDHHPEPPGATSRPLLITQARKGPPEQLRRAFFVAHR